MSEEKEIQKQSDEKENEKEELSEQDLKPVSGGAFNNFVKFGDIAGESTPAPADTKHKDWEIAVNRIKVP